MLRLLAALGTGFDCASKAEIEMITDMGVAGTKIVFANPTKPAAHLRSAVAAGVQMMTFDGADELFKIRSVCPSAALVEPWPTP